MDRGGAVADSSDSRALYYGGGHGGRAGKWVDGTALHGTNQTYPDENHHLANVIVDYPFED